jgi:hypothetical protein
MAGLPFIMISSVSAFQKMVIQTKSVEYMPLFLSLASLACGISWTAYALIKFDLYITVSHLRRMNACFHLLLLFFTTIIS